MDSGPQTQTACLMFIGSFDVIPRSNPEGGSNAPKRFKEEEAGATSGGTAVRSHSAVRHQWNNLLA